MKHGRSLALALGLIGASWGIWSGLASLQGSNGAARSQENQPADFSTLAQARGTLPQPSTTSGKAEIALAKHLRAIGAKVYGAYWCPHCHDQISMFGRDAARLLPYIECAEDGQNTRINDCRKAGVRGFPTWMIQGKTYEGTQSLQELAKASGYRGSLNFKIQR